MRVRIPPPPEREKWPNGKGTRTRNEHNAQASVTRTRGPLLGVYKLGWFDSITRLWKRPICGAYTQSSSLGRASASKAEGHWFNSSPCTNPAPPLGRFLTFSFSPTGHTGDSLTGRPLFRPDALVSARRLLARVHKMSWFNPRILNRSHPLDGAHKPGKGSQGQSGVTALVPQPRHLGCGLVSAAHGSWDPIALRCQKQTCAFPRPLRRGHIDVHTCRQVRLLGAALSLSTSNGLALPGPLPRWDART